MLIVKDHWADRYRIRPRKPVIVSVTNEAGEWRATSEELQVTAYGPTQEAALDDFEFNVEQVYRTLAEAVDPEKYKALDFALLARWAIFSAYFETRAVVEDKRVAFQF